MNQMEPTYFTIYLGTFDYVYLRLFLHGETALMVSESLSGHTASYMR